MSLRFKFLLFFLMIAGGSYCDAQSNGVLKACNFLTGLKYKNGVDTIYLLAYKTGSCKMGRDSNLIELEKQRKLKRANFWYGITFMPVDCDQEFACGCSDKSTVAFDAGKEDNKVLVKLRCIVYENYSVLNHVFFVVDQIKIL